MRVLIDARGVRSKLQGVGRHTLNLLLGLSYLESDLEFLVLYNSPLVHKVIERSGGPFRGRFQWIKASSRPHKGLGILERVEIPWLLKVNNVNLYHDVSASGLWTGNIPSVTTVHELESLHFNYEGQKSRQTPKRLKNTFRNARLIIAVSQYLSEEIESHFHISRPKIRVISNAVDPWYMERASAEEIKATRERFKISGKYFLCVTADRLSKNSALAEKCAKAWSGPEKWVFTIPRQLEVQKDQKVRSLGVVEDVWLRPLYAESIAVIVPSLYEGFSLPPIEALASGSIPVVSDIPPHREALGDILPKELFFDPSSSESLDRSLQTVLEGGTPMRASVLEKFKLVSDRYSVKDTAERVQAVYREALRK